MERERERGERGRGRERLRERAAVLRGKGLHQSCCGARRSLTVSPTNAPKAALTYPSRTLRCPLHCPRRPPLPGPPSPSGRFSPLLQVRLLPPPLGFSATPSCSCFRSLFFVFSSSFFPLLLSVLPSPVLCSPSPVSYFFGSLFLPAFIPAASFLLFCSTLLLLPGFSVAQLRALGTM